jgi:hypothetical protein
MREIGRDGFYEGQIWKQSPARDTNIKILCLLPCGI